MNVFLTTSPMGVQIIIPGWVLKLDIEKNNGEMPEGFTLEGKFLKFEGQTPIAEPCKITDVDAGVMDFSPIERMSIIAVIVPTKGLMFMYGSQMCAALGWDDALATGPGMSYQQVAVTIHELVGAIYTN